MNDCLKEGEFEVEKEECGGEGEEMTASQAKKALIGGKVIKRYQNRKLYDTQKSCYVTLDDIAKMIRSDNENIIVIDNKTKRDITAATLIQIIFEAEKKEAKYAPLHTLKEIIQYKNGSISGFLEKLGVFPDDSREKKQVIFREEFIPEKRRRSPKSQMVEVKPTLEERVARAAIFKPSSSFSSEGFESENSPPPDLPNPNQSLTN